MEQRWYDKFESSKDVIEQLKKLDKLSQQKLSIQILDAANSIKALKREQDEVPISLGIERALGLYQQTKNRRWYDKHPHLAQAFQGMSTLSEDECAGIMEALEMAMK